MDRSLDRNRWTVIDTVSYLIIGSVAGRMLPYYLPTPERWVVIGLWSVYAILFTIARSFSRRRPGLLHLYFLIQLLITLFLTLAIPDYDGPQDYFAILVFPLCIQAMWRLPRPVGARWVIIFCAVAALAMIVYSLDRNDSWEGIGYGLAYIAIGALISVFSAVTRSAEEARLETQKLNAELRAANEKLKDYARQVEQFAAAEERTRLARDLHDSVSQTIFSMTLTAHSARILLERDPQRVAGQLDHLQVLADNALSEMRSLIQHLRPGGLAADGLAACLRRHVLDRKAQDGLNVDLRIIGERRLPGPVEETLFRVVQEALNNVVKHAGVNSAQVVLCLDENPIQLSIEDLGCGFAPGQVEPVPGHLGLGGMADRIRSIGGRLEIESAPGAGTRIWVKDLVVVENEANA